MKKIAVALQGRSGSGKTEALNMLINHLESELGARRIDTFSEIGSDIGVILELEKTLIGVETRGDPGTNLKECLENLVKYKCQVIICATRTRGWTIEEFNVACSDYERVKVQQQYIDSSEGYEVTARLRKGVQERNIDLICHVCSSHKPS